MSPNLPFGTHAADFVEEMMDNVDELAAAFALAQLQEPQEPFRTLAEDTLPQQLDCIAWNHRHNVFVFGSYEIPTEMRGTRIGKIFLASLQDTADSGYIVHQTLSELPGILDMKWEPLGEKCLVAATSESVIIYSLDMTTGQTPSLSKVNCLQVAPHMALYFCWINPTKIIYSDSAGKLVTWDWNKEKEPEKEENEGDALEENPVDPEVGEVIFVSLYTFFVWFVHYDPEEQLVYSGDDYGCFRAFHLKDLTKPSVHAKHQFRTGVTSILTKREFVLVGCYDDHLRVFTRTVDSGIVKLSQAPLLTIDLGGTVWRTMWVPPLNERPDRDPEEEAELKVAVAAGRNGIHVLSIKPSDWTWETSFCCLEHKGYLAYGLDIHSNEENDNYTVATVYFDSHILHIFSLLP